MAIAGHQRDSRAAEWKPPFSLGNKIRAVSSSALAVGSRCCPGSNGKAEHTSLVRSWLSKAGQTSLTELNVLLSVSSHQTARPAVRREELTGESAHDALNAILSEAEIASWPPPFILLVSLRKRTLT